MVVQAKGKKNAVVTRKPTDKAKAAKSPPKPKAKKQTKAETKKAVEKILERHRLKLKTKPKAPAKAKATKAEAKPVKPKKPVRKRLKTGGPSKEMRTINRALWSAHQAIAAAKAREAKGLPVAAKVTISVPMQKALALQVRTSDDLEWGNLRTYNINAYTPQAQIKKYTKELRELQLGWVISNYFGSGAEYRIVEVERPAQTTTY